MNVLSLVTLAMFITSSYAVTCHYCDSRRMFECGIPFNSTDEILSCPGTVCSYLKWKENGRFVVYVLMFICTFA